MREGDGVTPRIEHDVPQPARGRSLKFAPDGVDAELLLAMKISDSFFTKPRENEDLKTCMTRVRNLCARVKMTHCDYRFATNRRTEDKVAGIRVWRIEDE